MAAETASAELKRTNQSGSARRDLVELSTGYGLILATIWTPNPIQRVLYWLAFAWIIATTWARHDGWTALGLGRKGLLRSLWVVGVALLLAAATIFIAYRTHTLHRLHGPTPIYLHGWGYIVWSIMQQFLLQSYFLLRFLRLLPGKTAPILAATTIFALAHLPNPILTPITFVWGAIACVLFLRYRNIYTLGLAHGIMGLCVAVTVPNSLHHHMRVGLGYLRYHPRAQDRRLADRGLPATEPGAPYLDFEMWASCEARPLSLTEPNPDTCHGTGCPHISILRCGHRAEHAALSNRAKPQIPHHLSQSDHNVSTDACVTADAPTLRS